MEKFKELTIKFPEIFFENLARCTKAKVTFKIKENIMLIFRPKRKVPFAAEASINKELDHLQQKGVLTKTNYSEWASPIIHVKKKNDKIKACTDFSTGLNDCLETYYYPLPSPEDILAKLSGGRVFSKLDLSEAYLQIGVNEECTKYLTIKTLKSLYRLNRLPFKIKVALGIFH